jgi:trk system potassium uptake protein TrkH
MSISSFCNAGFDVFGESGKEFLSLNSFASDVTMLLPIMMLVVIGGIGFIVLFDLFSKEKKKQHTKVVLLTTAILLLGGGIIFTIFEWNNPNTLGGMPWYNKILNGFFQSVTTRTAGASTIDQSLFTTGSRVLTMMLMFIGGAPNSTAGGIKVTTLFILLLFMFRLPNDNGDIRFRERKVSRKVIMKAFRIIMYTLFVLLIAIVLIRVFEGDLIPFESIIFECVSAISTVGLSMGITPLLTVGSKMVLTMLMFIGRIGIVTFVTAISSRGFNQPHQEIEFTNTDIMVG